MKYVIKTFQKKKYEELRKYLFKIKEFNETILGKGFFTSLKGELA